MSESNGHKARFVLPCGCAVVVEHRKGDRLTVCEGGGLTPLERLRWERCPGGRAYSVRAEEVVTVRFQARPMNVVTGEAGAA